MRRRREVSIAEDGHQRKRSRREDEPNIQNFSWPPQELSEYHRGSILKLRLQNFVTYDDVTIYPGPKLNVILGPNGSGKSSIFCGLVLGCGGSSSLLGRAHDEKDFIKHGKDNAQIDLVLFGGKESHNQEIRRVIVRKGASTWHLNGRPSSQKETVSLCARMNVQVDNLCQFLPQDKVASFASMTSSELLRATERAVGPPEMLRDHQRLISSREDAVGVEQRVRGFEASLNEKRQINEGLERDVRQLRERQYLLDQVKNLELKRPWVVYKEQKRTMESLLNKLQSAEQSLAQLRKEIEPILLEKRRVSEEETSLKKIVEEEANNVNKCNKAVRDLQQKLESYDAEVAAYADSISRLENRELDRQRSLKNARNELEAAQDALKEMKSRSVLDELVVDMNRKLREMNQRKADVQSGELEQRDLRSEQERTIQRIRRELQQLEDVHANKLNQLHRYYPDVYTAYRWLQVEHNKSLFEKPVLGPVFMEVDVPDDRTCDYLEMSVAKNSLMAFVCQTRNDSKTLTAELTTRQRLRITVVDSLSTTSFIPRRPLDQLRQYDVHHYLSDLIRCPKPVMNFLCNFSDIHNIAIGSNRTQSEFLHDLPQGLFYTPDRQIRVGRSRYEDRAVWRRENPLRRAKVLTQGADPRDRQRLQMQLDEIQRKLAIIQKECSKREAEVQEVDSAISRIRTERDSIQTQIRNLMTLKRRIENKEREVQSLECETSNETEKAKIREMVRATNDKRRQTTVAMADVMEELVNSTVSQNGRSLRRREIQRRLGELTVQVRQAEEQQSATVREAEKRIEERRAYEGAKEDVEAKKAEAQEESPKTVDLKALFKTLPDQLAELDVAIRRARARAELTAFASSNVLEKYDMNRQEIADLEHRLETESSQLRGQLQDIEQVKARWLGPLRQMVQEINKGFGQYFSMINCAGEVTLREDEDFSRYGMVIQVKYRDSEPLMPLDAFTQSGGERAVATMLYLTALQELTKVPFRAVDEMNQGMDPVNERLVFDIISTVVGRPHLPQYFLITPKLLPDLKYGVGVCVHCVFNGPWTMSHNEWTASLEHFDEK